MRNTLLLTLVGFTLAAALFACTTPPEEPMLTITRLRGMIETYPRFWFGASCAADDDLRPTLGCSRRETLLRDVRPFPEEGGPLRVKVAVPARLVGTPLVVRTQWIARKAQSWQQQSTRFYPRAPKRIKLEFPIDEIRTDRHRTLRLRAEGFRVFPRELEWKTREFVVPDSSEFRAGIALESVETGRPRSGARFIVRAVGDDGLDEVLHDSTIDGDVDPGWKDITADLTHLAGRKVRVVFETQRRGDGVSFPLFGAPRLLQPSLRRGARNVILVSLDTLRGDQVEKAVGEISLMPELGAWASGGALFEQAFSAYPSTSAGHMTLFTSTWPVEHRVTFANEVAPAWLSTLTEAMAAAGYATAAVTENAMLAAHSGFARGFDSYKENRSIGSWESAGEAETTIRDGISWLEKNRDDIFFLFLHTYEVHEPYAPPPELRLPVDPSATRAEKRLRRYQGEARHLDQILGSLFRALEELQLEEETIVVITSDHGEAFGEHGHFGHSRAVYDEDVRVPLIFRGPGIRAGQRFPSQISLVDVAPTLLELTGLPIPSSMRGRSLAPALRGGALPPGDEFLFLEAPVDPKRGKGRIFAARSDKYKFIGREDTTNVEEIYDLEADPQEKTNLATNPELQELARRVLAQYRAYDQQAKDRAAGKAATQPPSTQTLDSDMQEKLKALGYVD